MFTAARSLRLYSTASCKPSIRLVADLRKLTDVSVTKARDALAASDNDVQAALQWLQRDLALTGASKAAKVSDRTANEGLVGVSVLSGAAEPRAGLGLRAAMVELNCETDFVARNDLFGSLLADISHTAAFMAEPVQTHDVQQQQQQHLRLIRPFQLDLLRDAPLLSRDGKPHDAQATVGTAIRDLIAKVGEKISLRRAQTLVLDPLPHALNNLALRAATYSHGSVGRPSQGRIGALALTRLVSPRLAELLASEAFKDDLAALERALARQVVGFPTVSVRSPDGTTDEGALYDQEFMMYSGSNGERVQAVLKRWARERGVSEDGAGGLDVLEFAKWTVGESVEAAEP